MLSMVSVALKPGIVPVAVPMVAAIVESGVEERVCSSGYAGQRREREVAEVELAKRQSPRGYFYLVARLPSSNFRAPVPIAPRLTPPPCAERQRACRGSGCEAAAGIDNKYPSSLSCPCRPVCHR